ncbi:MAG: hypothetical protein ABIN01_23915 [Ferruginibacter sp.]
MLLQGNLFLKYDNKVILLMVKVLLRKGIYYFFVKEKENLLLHGETLVLTYEDSFYLPRKENEDNYKNIPSDIINAITQLLMNNKQSWLFTKAIFTSIH